MAVPILPYMIIVGYARTSTDHEQDLSRQLKQLEESGVPEHLIYTDSAQSGAKDPESRPGYKQLIKVIKTGEVGEIIVTDLSRLGRDAKGTLQEIWKLQDLGVKVRSLSSMDQFVLNAQPELQPLLTSAVTLGADLQRKKTIEDTQAGLQRAKLKGKKLGRPFVKIDWDLIESWKAKGLSERAAVKICGYAYTTFYRQKKERVDIKSEVNKK